MGGWRSSSFVTDIEWICLWHWATDEESTDDEEEGGGVNIVLEEKTIQQMDNGRNQRALIGFSHQYG